jgi:hypothetical protein
MAGFRVGMTTVARFRVIIVLMYVRAVAATVAMINCPHQISAGSKSELFRIDGQPLPIDRRGKVRSRS